MNCLDILLVDDDMLAARLLKAQLDRPGRTRADVAGSAEEGFEQYMRGRYHALVTDMMMGGGADGLVLLRRVREVDATVPVVVLTAHASLERAVEAVRAGATDFLEKPPNTGALLALLERAVAQQPWQEEALALRKQWRGVDASELVRGDHPALDAVRRFAEQVSAVPEGRVLI